MQNQDKVLLFDGVCNLCNSAVNFLLDADKSKTLKFASLQSAFGQKILSDYQLSRDNFDSVLYLKGGRIYKKSEAAFLVMRELGGFWRVISVFKFLPKAFCDLLYDAIAKNRYKIFGRREACRMPTPELKARFLE
jgi:predicted DCC family thiol-disulfide oxidoreductase YuxK